VTVEYVEALDEPACLDRKAFGGKAAGLATLVAAGLPVPPGFAIGTAAYRAFREQSRVPEAVAAEIRAGYRRLCERTGVADLAVAVRSSATAEDSALASLAGEFGTWLDVSGEDVVAYVHRCWGTAGRRRRPVPPDDLEMAVVVQKTVRAKASGVMFTVSPVAGDRSRIVVEASWGLGLAVVGGEVTPDRWVVDKVGLSIVDRMAGDKRIEYRRGDTAIAVEPDRWATPCLSDEEVLALAGLGKRIERGQGCPQDIEFAVDGDLPAGANLVLLQCRPETVWARRSPRPRFPAGHGVTSWISDAVKGRR
jgi:pyruvate,water dikinase